jgi:hypothetical protein
MARKKTLEGFGSVTKSGQGNLAGTLKNLGEMLSKKGVRPVGGNVTGVTSGGKAAGGDIKMKPIAGKGICCVSAGKGPKDMPSSDNVGLKTTDLGAGKTLGGKNVRPQP